MILGPVMTNGEFEYPGAIPLLSFSRIKPPNQKKWPVPLTVRRRQRAVNILGTVWRAETKEAASNCDGATKILCLDEAFSRENLRIACAVRALGVRVISLPVAL